MRDSSACMKADREESKLSRKPHPRTKDHVSMLYTAELRYLLRYYKYLKTMAAVRHLVQGHPRSSTLVLLPIENPYETSY